MPAMPMHVGIVVRDDPVVVVLLCHGGYSCSSLSLGMLMTRVAGVLWWVVALLLMQPRRFSLILMLVRKHMLGRQHLRCI